MTYSTLASALRDTCNMCARLPVQGRLQTAMECWAPCFKLSLWQCSHNGVTWCACKSDNKMRYYSAFAVYNPVISSQCTSCTCTFGQLLLQIRLTWLAGPGCRKVTGDQLPATELLVSLSPGIQTAPYCIYKLVQKHAKILACLATTRITSVPPHTSMRCPANTARCSP
jgi:hypothetical protein